VIRLFHFGTAVLRVLSCQLSASPSTSCSDRSSPSNVNRHVSTMWFFVCCSHSQTVHLASLHLCWFAGHGPEAI